ncbi:MAG: hypothetical protein U0S50_16245 [Sphingopyxis sp.]|uniref:hypothetical protein n=1 Tax=Sphingopyxis sp. TaxID=1908224 RepID=UPI002ABA1744|nr:hypothetical protein [Sphingopyxis sp.]MDZ3833345.1 hypothetical protein [Sphingopyxis sp.]
MKRKLALGLASIMMVAAPTAALGTSFGFNLRAIVPVHCVVNHHATGFGAVNGNAVSLGTFREYCNAPAGYELVVDYAPGSLRGARIIAGSEEIILNGSGQAVLSRTTGPRVRERIIAAVPGENGFDTDRLELRIVPI